MICKITKWLAIKQGHGTSFSHSPIITKDANPSDLDNSVFLLPVLIFDNDSKSLTVLVH